MVFYNPEIDRVNYVDEREYIGNGGEVIPSIEIRLPALATGQRFDNIAITTGRESAHVMISFRAYTTVRRADGVTRYHKVYSSAWLTDPMLSTLTATVTDAVDMVTGETVLTVAFPSWDTARAWEWTQDISITSGSPSYYHHTGLSRQEFLDQHKSCGILVPE